jgi:hypothetical protein
MDDPYLDTYLFPKISGVMVSIIAFGAKTLGWEHSNETLKNDVENLRIVLYSTEVFSGKCVLENGERRRRIYERGHCV